MNTSKLAGLVFLVLTLGVAQHAAAGAGCNSYVTITKEDNHRDECANISCERTSWSLALWISVHGIEIGGEFGGTHVECVGGPLFGRTHAHPVKRSEVFNAYRNCQPDRLRADIDYEMREGTTTTTCAATLTVGGVTISGSFSFETPYFYERITVDQSCMWCNDCIDDPNDADDDACFP